MGMDKHSSNRGTQADEVEGLRRRHQELERRLSELERHLSLTPNEQVERARLKKEKLWVKDRMLVLGAAGEAAGRATG
jgi:uncharacterized protein YdcH (DUF465 family)